MASSATSAEQLKLPRIEVDQQQPLQGWNRDVCYANLRIHNADACVQGSVHRSEDILFEEMPLHVGMKLNGEDVGFFIYPVRLSINIFSNSPFAPPSDRVHHHPSESPKTSASSSTSPSSTKPPSSNTTPSAPRGT